MKKPQHLRQVIETACPIFKDHPDRLHLFVEDGQIVGTGANSLSFEYNYNLTIIATDYTQELGRLIVSIYHYLKINQPEIFFNPSRREKAFKFEIDFNSHDSLDVSITLSLTERVIVKQDSDQGVLIHYADEPLFVDYEPLSGVEIQHEPGSLETHLNFFNKDG